MVISYYTMYYSALNPHATVNVADIADGAYNFFLQQLVVKRASVT